MGSPAGTGPGLFPLPGLGLRQLHRLHYILVAMFLGIWSSYLHDTLLLIAGILGGILSVLLSFVVPFKLHIVLATLIVSVIACWLEVRNAGVSK